MRYYESPSIIRMPLEPEQVEMAGRCRGRSQICGHGDDGCMTPDITPDGPAKEQKRVEVLSSLGRQGI